MKETPGGEFILVDISEQDVVEAMKRIAGYIDITPGDFKVSVPDSLFSGD